MEATKHKAIRVKGYEPGNECPFTECDKRAADYSIERGSGYVTACKEHAQELIDEAVEAGDIYQD